jgi:hypothetical protein
MPVLMGGDFYSKISPNSLLDCEFKTPLSFGLARQGDEDRAGALSYYCGRDLVPIEPEAIGKRRWNFVIEEDVIFSLVVLECDECGLAASLRPMQVLVER